MRTSIRILILSIAFLLLGASTAAARNYQQASDDVTLGAQLYDRWYAALGVNAPSGNMPIWERQTNNTRSGPDTWRCSECHGWDYKGSEGVYATGSHFTGFPSVMKLVMAMSESEIIDHLKGYKDPSHDFSKYIKDENLARLAKFLKEGLPDDSASIDPVTMNAVGGSVENGKKLYDANCSKCHGLDGKLIIFRTEGVNEYLGTVANRDPFRFLHRTRFGVAGVQDMPVGRALGWQTSDSVDVLAYVQGLPTGVELQPITNAGSGSQTSPKLGGPLGGVLGGLLTGLGTVFGMLGISAAFMLGLGLIGALVIWALRKRK